MDADCGAPDSEPATLGGNDVKRTLTASVTGEGDWYVVQCLEVDIASQGKTADDALANLREALELHFEPPTATILPEVRPIEVEIGAA